MHRPLFRHPLRTALLAGALALASACTTAPVVPSTSPTPTVTPSPRDFTVITAEHVTTTDPAAVTTDVGATVALNLYQRLMLVQPGTGDLKPDLASDCLYTSATVYECKLAKELSFSNGHWLTSSDVKFSILRTLRLRVPGSSAALLNSLDTIETPDPQTVRFRLLWPDSQFGFGLAAPGASIVDEEFFDADQLLPVDRAPVGSGPYALGTLDDKGLTLVKRDKYVGPNGAEITPIRIRYADSPAAEEALKSGATDMVWRTLDDAALARLQAEMDASADHLTVAGFRRWLLPGTVVRRLVWNPNSALRQNNVLRKAVANSLQADRTLDSIVPGKVAGHASVFPVGGRPKVVKPSGRRITLTLSYPTSSPGLGDLARMQRDRVENAAGVSVQLIADDATADLLLTERAAWVNTALGWLQEYLDRPLAISADKLAALEMKARTTDQADVRLAALTELQKQAVADATVLPVSQGGGTLILSQKLDLVGEAFGPTWQLGLWGVRWKP